MYSSASSCISIYLLEILPSVTVSQIPDFRYSYNCHTAFNEVLICSFCLSSYCISPSSDCSNISARSFFKFSLFSINCSEYACASLKFSPHLTYLHSLSAWTDSCSLSFWTFSCSSPLRIDCCSLSSTLLYIPYSIALTICSSTPYPSLSVIYENVLKAQSDKLISGE